MMPGDQHWIEVVKTNRQARRMADRHYTFHGKPMSHEIGPPGQKIVLLTNDSKAVWGSHRPAPWAGITRADGLIGHFCFLFRNEGYQQCRSSELIEAAVMMTNAKWGIADFWTYVAVDQVQSSNPGYCYFKAGFTHDGWTFSQRLGWLRRLVLRQQA